MPSSNPRRHSATDPPSNSAKIKNQVSLSTAKNAIFGAPKSSEPNHHVIPARTKTNSPDLSVPNLSKSKTGSVLGLGKPSTLPSNSSKRHLSTSDLPSKSTTSKKKIKIELDLRKNRGSAEGLRCHQCRVEMNPEDIISCSNQESVTFVAKSRNSEPTKISQNAESDSPLHQNHAQVTRPCRKSFCMRCLSSRYGEDLLKIRPNLKTPYQWNCPVCKDYCNCSNCRKKKGLPPTGKLAKLATEAGFMSARELLEVNPNVQGAELLVQEANRREKEKQNQDSSVKVTAIVSKTKAKDGSIKQSTVKPKSSSSKSISSTKKSQISSKNQKSQVIHHSTDQLKKHQKLQKDIKANQANNKKLKKEQQSIKVNTKNQSTSDMKSAQLQSSKKVTDINDANNRAEKTDKNSLSEALQPSLLLPKGPLKRSPNTVQPPTKVFHLATGGLSSSQILKRMNVREFICRFKEKIPGLGGTEDDKNGSSRTESARASKVIDSMDDLSNFWIDDEGGMRAIVNGLVKLIESDLNSNPDSSSQILKSDQALPLLTQVKRESKFAISPSPYLQSSVACWTTATNFLELEGLEDQLEKDTQNSYCFSSSTSSSTMSAKNNSDANSIHDDRLRKVKFPPVNKLAIVSAFIDVALRGHTLSDDLVQGIERERLAKAEIMKQRVKLNKQWGEIKAKQYADMPMRKSLLIKSTTDEGEGNGRTKQMIENPSRSLLDQESARLKAVAEWEADVNNADNEHKHEMRRTYMDQFQVECMNRLRFQSIGQDTGERRYYTLSSTPGGVPLQSPNELDFAWSHNLIIHGSELTNAKKGKMRQKKSMESVNIGLSNGKTNDEGKTMMVDEVGRESNDHWFRISDPDEIRHTASWIEYHAKLNDFKNSTLNLKGIANSNSSASNSRNLHNGNIDNLISDNNCVNSSSSSLKEVTNLVDQINRFADLVQFQNQSQLEKILDKDRRNFSNRFRNL